ncbi:thioredoxin family protein [Zobellia galactanivorans]|uniref:thioredoxin family protein n=1 Tax=Zobellia galactanivorans (strain DSM 12802 / CCUG 47099 / CIP 106680 / NCIMB 13871 / Dsij) TaxID=63186 RepID=UPI001C0666F1|nr:thioredoxin family protein [Zobellia galactanivorans]MBU3025406.1 thioredoxin family protein [Zobellia galactanivorans]
MKKIIVLFFVALASSLSAQDWQEDYTQALALSKADNKKMVLVFAGSDWCAPCIKLDKTIWQSEEFKKFAQNELILYKADFPRKKANQLSAELSAKNKELAEKFNHQGHFPLVVLLSEKEEVLGQTGYLKLSPKEYVAHLKSML